MQCKLKRIESTFNFSEDKRNLFKRFLEVFPKFDSVSFFDRTLFCLTEK